MVNVNVNAWDYSRWSLGLGLTVMGLGLLAIGWSDLDNAMSLWWCVPLAAIGLFGTLCHRLWLEHQAWQRGLTTRIAQRLKQRDDQATALAKTQALATLRQRFKDLDQLALAVRSSQIVVWMVDVPAKVITFDGTLIGAKDFLAETQSYQGRDWYLRLHPDDLGPVESRFKDFLRGRLGNFEHEHRVPDGRGGWRWVLSRGLIIHKDEQGRTTMAAGTYTDIHQQKLAQMSFRQERALFDTGPVVMLRFQVGQDEAIDYASQNLSKLWRHDRSWTALNKPMVDLVNDADMGTTRAAIKQALTEGQPGTENQVRVRFGDGTLQWHLMRGTFEWEDERIFVRAYLINIAERKALEAQAQQHKQTLESLVSQLNAAQADNLILQNSSDLLNSAQDVDEAFQIVRRAATSLFPGFSGALSALMAHGGLSVVGSWGQPPPMDKEFQMKDCWGLRRGRPHGFLASGIHLCCHHLHPADVQGLTPYICVPMSANGETVGALHLHADGPVTEPELQTTEARAERFAETLKLAMSNLRLRASLRDQATRDGLTGLYNRRLLDERLPIEIKRSQRDQAPVSLAMIDVDHFKNFNDRHGHEAGDIVLQAVAALLLERVRVYDLACRYGGEEMVLVMPGCHLEDATAKMEHLRQEVSALQVPYQGRALPPVTISIGLAMTLQGSPEALIRCADEALYTAKRQGRNRLVLAPQAAGALQEAPP